MHYNRIVFKMFGKFDLKIPSPFQEISQRNRDGWTHFPAKPQCKNTVSDIMSLSRHHTLFWDAGCIKFMSIFLILWFRFNLGESATPHQGVTENIPGDPQIILQIIYSHQQKYVNLKL